MGAKMIYGLAKRDLSPVQCDVVRMKWQVEGEYGFDSGLEIPLRAGDQDKNATDLSFTAYVGKGNWDNKQNGRIFKLSLLETFLTAQMPETIKFERCALSGKAEFDGSREFRQEKKIKAVVAAAMKHVNDLRQLKG